MSNWGGDRASATPEDETAWRLLHAILEDLDILRPEILYQPVMLVADNEVQQHLTGPSAQRYLGYGRLAVVRVKSGRTQPASTAT